MNILYNVYMKKLGSGKLKTKIIQKKHQRTVGL